MNTLMNNYIQFLKNKYPSLVKPYQTRLKDNLTGARAEAVTFHFFESYVDEVKVNETRKGGGTDFLCKTEDSVFLAEITGIATDTVTNKSGLKNELTEEITIQSPCQITKKLCGIVYDKHSQMSEYNYPGILVITSDHILADTLFDPFNAQCLLIGNMSIGVPIPINGRATPESNPINQTDLKNGCFLQMNQGWDVCNRNISAVLLFHISGVNAFLTGILHPEPIHKFSPKLLPSVSFIRLINWPPDDNILEVEWVKYVGNEIVPTEPEQTTFGYNVSFN
ncbi:hypothetical protein F4212_07145 [Candidatus Poribacteria bacterium]|nr:hypothetical protein [Candidatus Poribacteria bacterium]